MHLFFTRLALQAAMFGRKNRSPEYMQRFVDLWRGASSAFYERQTRQTDYKVILLCDRMYEEVVQSRPFPSWAETFYGRCQEWFTQHDELVGKPVYLTRVDADDSYSIDFIETLEALNLKQRTLILHKRFRQYNLRLRALTSEMSNPNPHFATVYMPACPRFGTATANEFTGLLGRHSSYHRHAHIEAPACLALERITGYNLENKYMKVWGRSKKVGVSKALDPRFVGYHPPASSP